MGERPRPIGSMKRRPWRAGRLRSAALLVVGLLAASTACREDPPRSAPEPTRLAAAQAAAARLDAPASIAATVTRVADGDSFVARLADGRTVEVRLQGIDAPEARQPFGREAGENLRRLALDERLALRRVDRDPYGRWVVVATSDDGDLALLQIRGGFAWHNVRYAREQDEAFRERYAAAEREARAQRRGLWAAAQPVAPWDYKREQRSGEALAAPSRERLRGDDTAAAGSVVGNRRSRVYHLPGCPGHSSVATGNRVLFASEEAAREAGYRRAGNC